MRQPTPVEWRTICSLFDQLLDLQPATRAKRLGDPALDRYVAQRVGAMLAAGDTSGVLDRPAAATAHPGSDYASLAEGTLVGRFRIQRLIGRGGSGEVYRAVRDDGSFAQRVALKLLRPEAAGHAELFDRERALLASLEHPGIARLIDGGTAPDGRPFMALEFVEGQDIAQWCGAHAADLDQRLALFLEVTDAVAYAHARLVMHRDIKPANILIDRAGRVRLLDFGIARLLDDDVHERTRTQALLTPEYAAPEQLENARTTVATDIYALGALLFELLTGAGPWAQGDASMPAIVRRILHEDVAVPSRRAAAGPSPPIPPRRLAGDLDAIVLKAMRRAPENRYASVAALADDVRRHLAFEPVRAHTGSAAYYARRFVRRNRWGVAAAVALFATLLAGAAGVAWQARQTALERDAARTEAARQEATNQALLLMFSDAGDAATLGSTSVAVMIADTRARVEALPPASPDAPATVAALADLYLIVENRAEAKAILAGALDRGVGAADPVAAARLKLKLGTVLIAERRHAAGRALLDQAEATWRSDPVRYRRERVETAGARAVMLRQQGDANAAVATLEDAFADAELAYVASPRDLATRTAHLVRYLTEDGRVAEADAFVQRTRATLARQGQGRSAAALNLRWQEADIAELRGDLGAAERILRELVTQRRRLFGRSASLAADLMRHGRVLLRLDRPQRALAALDEAASLAVDHIGAGAASTQRIALARVEALAALGRDTAAEAALGAVATRMPRSSDELTTGAYLRARAAIAIAQGRRAEAIADLEAADSMLARAGAAGQRRDVQRMRARL